MFKNSYRIVPDIWNGYEVQVRYWFFPFWMQLGGTNTHVSVEKAKRYLEEYITPVYETKI